MADGVIVTEGLTVSLAPTPLQQFNEARKRVGRKVVLCTPTPDRPHPAYFEAVKASVPLLEAAGLDHHITWMVGCAYISAARAIMTRRALDAGADIIVYIDHDVSWEPYDLLKLIEYPTDVAAGTYRFKYDEIEYMGRPWRSEKGNIIARGDPERPGEDDAIRMLCVPAGFLKITRNGVNRFMRKYPELMYGEECSPSVDLFQHGAHDRIWFGEDYAFCRRWNEIDNVWCLPNLNITHHSKDKAYPGNYRQHLLEQARKEKQCQTASCEPA
jgi:hypothetical protein